ncbi:hypothetical protein RRG08_066111, partial [Elysia crispata]
SRSRSSKLKDRWWLWR